MKLIPIHAGLFKLDGGAMFGVVPKTLWQKLNPPDEHNLCTWAMRCLYVEDGDRKILIDTGMGTKQDAKFRSHFHPHGEQSLRSSLNNYGIAPDEITDVFLTHLHFDHVGGAVFYDENKQPVLQFPNAKYWTNKKHWDWAMTPNYREKASFLKENFVPILEQEQLHFIKATDQVDFSDNIKVRIVHGHTEAMMLPQITLDDGRQLLYCADLLPSTAHIGMPYVMGYDIRPLNTLAEKEKLFSEALKDDFILFLEHDKDHDICTLKRNEKGRIVLNEFSSLQAYLHTNHG